MDLQKWDSTTLITGSNSNSIQTKQLLQAISINETVPTDITIANNLNAIQEIIFALELATLNIDKIFKNFKSDNVRRIYKEKEKVLITILILTFGYINLPDCVYCEILWYIAT